MTFPFVTTTLTICYIYNRPFIKIVFSAHYKSTKWMKEDPQELALFIGRTKLLGLQGFMKLKKKEEHMENNKKRPDRRVLYTKMFLRESLLTLMKEKPVSKITPTELCRHAGINRNTFYTHYSSAESLLQSIEDDLYNEICQSIELSLEQGINLALVTNVNQVIFNNRDLCITLFSDLGDKNFFNRIIDLIHDRIIDEWKKIGVAVTEEQMEMLYTFYTGGSVAIIRNWAQEGMKKSPLELAQFISKVGHTGLQGYLEQEK